MANRTDKEAYAIHGTNPQNLIEYISRQKIYDSVYWKQECFGLSAERLVDKAVELKEVGGMYGEPAKPTHFIALILKMLQIQPSKDVVVEFIKNDDFKYLRLLGAFYLRLVGRPLDVYQYLEPLYNDYRKVRVRELMGKQELGHVDELIDAMLTKDRLFTIALPRLPARLTLERAGQLEPRVSVLDEEFDEAALEEEQEEQAAALEAQQREAAEGEQGGEEGEVAEEGERERRREREKWQLTKEEKRRRPGRSRSRSRSRSRERGGERRRSRSREGRHRSRSRDRYDRDRRDERDYRRRSRSRSRDCYRRDDRERRRSRSREDRRRDDRGRDRDREREHERERRRDDGDRRRRERSGSPGGRKGDKRARQEEPMDEIAQANALRASLGLKPLNGSSSAGSVAARAAHSSGASSAPAAAAAAAAAEAPAATEALPGEHEVRPGVYEGYWRWQGHRIRYQRSGDAGPAVLCIHGFGASADHWRKNLGELGQSCRAFAIDLLGYGFSDKPDPRQYGPPSSLYNFPNWSQQVRDFLREVVGGPATLTCNSVGGIAGLQAAIDDPSLVRGVQIMNISLRMLHVSKQAPWQRPLVKTLQDTLRTSPLGAWFFGQIANTKGVRQVLQQCYGDPAAVDDELVDIILTPGLQPGAVDVFLDFISYSSGPLPEQQLEEVTVPVSIVWGEEDPWEKVEWGRQLAKHAAVQEYVQLPGVGHCPQDEAPHLVNPLILAFVQRCGSS
ncbi:chloroplastic isoform X1 [Chlorella sorokiniana]|uniref:Chloroplastic isoform X1 n=1 Tax=Chlorella sorokiniana TaxID=3076 RepID=A0A2P6TCW4_CHLSO|nr:chloroplastic isoform X1 [Chlorella sorokiniana]|eukprot:PRW20472.1 chloroplastic isoform X1 [Chlorella sorokiniana]